MRLVEALDLAAGLGMVGPRVLGLDAEGEQLLFGGAGHLVVALGGEDEPVVGEERRRIAPGLGRFVQYPDDVGGLDHPHGPEATHSREWSSMMLSTS